MDENKKNAKSFYLTLALVLAIVVVLIVATAVARRTGDDKPLETDVPTSEQPQDKQTVSETDNLPTFALPVNAGSLGMDFSDTLPVFSQTMKDYRTHLGVDINADIGSEVLSVADGTVTNVWEDPFMGTCVSIEHSGTAVSIYKNLAPEIKDGIAIGCYVKQGDIIGAVGESAMNEIADEPHVHYELKISNKHVDPKDHLPFLKNNEQSNGENTAKD